MATEKLRQSSSRRGTSHPSTHTPVRLHRVLTLPSSASRPRPDDNHRPEYRFEQCLPPLWKQCGTCGHPGAATEGPLTALFPRVRRFQALSFTSGRCAGAFQLLLITRLLESLVAHCAIHPQTLPRARHRDLASTSTVATTVTSASLGQTQ